MGIWRNHVVVVLNYSVEIFTLPSLGPLLPNPAYHFGCQSLSLPMDQEDCDSEWVGEAFLNEFQQFPLDIIPNVLESALRVSIRDRSQAYYALTLTETPEDSAFTWDENVNNFLSYGTLKLCVGVSNEYQLRLSFTNKTLYPITLELSRIHATSPEIDLQCDIHRKLVLPTSGLPILDTTTAMDFDDAVERFASCNT